MGSSASESNVRAAPKIHAVEGRVDITLREEVRPVAAQGSEFRVTCGNCGQRFWPALSEGACRTCGTTDVKAAARVAALQGGFSAWWFANLHDRRFLLTLILWVTLATFVLVLVVARA